MDPYLSVILTLALVYVSYKFVSRVSRGADGPAHDAKETTPPCLPWVPLLGSLPFLVGLDPLHLRLAEKGRKYGNIFAFYAARRCTLVLNSYEDIHEALVKKSLDFAGRGMMYAEDQIWNPESRGIVFRQFNEGYKLNRFHSAAVLKHLGVGDRQVMEKTIHTEIEHFFEFVRSKNGLAFDPRPMIELCAMNVTYSTLFGQRAELESPTEIYLRSILRERVATLLPVYDIFPWITYLPWVRKKMAALRPIAERYIQFLKNKVRESRDVADNFVSDYIQRVGSEYDQDELAYIIRDIVDAGTETTASQLSWMLILIGNHPEVMKRIQAEMDAVVPKDRLPSMEDKPNLPYSEAALLEVMRIKIVNPLGMPHITLCDTELRGFKIPADTPVICNPWSAHMNPDVWPEPDKFQPERFLDDKNNVTGRERVISFGMGKRVCLGEALARQELFLFTTALLQQFDILPPEGCATIRAEERVGITMQAAPFTVRLVARE